MNFKFNKQFNVTTDVKHEPLDGEKLDVKNNTFDAIIKYFADYDCLQPVSCLLVTAYRLLVTGYDFLYI